MFHRNNLYNINFFPLALRGKRFFVLSLYLIIILSSNRAVAQYSVSGDNRSTIEYRQIKTEKFHIVYPHYYENNAQILARILDTMLPKIGQSLNTNPQRIPILIHTRSSKSNGLSVWAPKRLEFWTTTPPTTYAYPYMWQLALHEYRHGAQMSALNCGVTKILTDIFGEHVLGAVEEVFLPAWFMEGDAVMAETALAPAGRGDEPQYNIMLKGMVQSTGVYGVDKMQLGSMKDFVVDKYAMGYFLVSYAKERYGNDIWGQYLNSMGKTWWTLNAWEGEHEDKSLSLGNLLTQTVDTLKTIWQKDDLIFLQEKEDSVLIHWGKPVGEYTNYLNPIRVNDSVVLAIRYSKFEVKAIVELTPSGEREVVKVPYLLHDYFDYKDGKILFAQYSPSVRWQQESKADIIQYDIKEKTYSRITSEATMFTPIYNPKDDTLIAAVMTNDMDMQSLRIISPKARSHRYGHFAKNKHTEYLKNIDYDYTIAMSYPAWDKQGEDVFAIITDTKGKAIIHCDIEKETFTPLTEFAYDNIRYLKIFEDRIYFIAPVNGRYQILSIDKQNPEDILLHTHCYYGVDNFSLYDKQITLSTYTPMGYRIISIENKPRQYNGSENKTSLPFVNSIRKMEDFTLTKETINPDLLFPSKKYSKLTHLFDFHSWAPFYMNIHSLDLGVGVSLMSQNLLSSSVAELGYKHNFHQKDMVFLHYTYSGLYPVFDFIATYQPRSIRTDLDSNIVQNLHWDEVILQQQISLPYTWVNRNAYNNINFSFLYNISMVTSGDRSIHKTTYNSLGYQLTNSHYTAMAQNDLYPRWGMTSKIKYMHTLVNGEASLLAASMQLYFPGLKRNHSLLLNANMQFNTPEVYYFPNEVSFLRGYEDLFPKRYYGAMLSYHMPLAYPDFALGRVLYMKRLVLRPFYAVGDFDKQYYCSFGSDIEAKIHILRITAPVNIGLRLGYTPQRNKPFCNFLFSIDI